MRKRKNKPNPNPNPNNPVGGHLVRKRKSLNPSPNNPHPVGGHLVRNKMCLYFLPLHPLQKVQLKFLEDHRHSHRHNRQRHQKPEFLGRCLLQLKQRPVAAVADASESFINSFIH